MLYMGIEAVLVASEYPQDNSCICCCYDNCGDLWMHNVQHKMVAMGKRLMASSPVFGASSILFPYASHERKIFFSRIKMTKMLRCILFSKG